MATRRRLQEQTQDDREDWAQHPRMIENSFHLAGPSAKLEIVKHRILEDF
jgi:hypothetical protein